MAAQYIQLGDRGWNILVYYNADSSDFIEIEDSLIQLDCPEEDVDRVYQLLKHYNTGFTFSNTDYKMSIVCISKATNSSQFVSTCVHEAKHVQSHICSYYNISENSEEAAYLIGYMVKRMYTMIMKLLKYV